MAVIYENQCVCCGFPCIHNACKYYRVPIQICDKCGNEVDKLYYGLKGDELCANCALDELEKVEIDN